MGASGELEVPHDRRDPLRQLHTDSKVGADRNAVRLVSEPSKQLQRLSAPEKAARIIGIVFYVWMAVGLTLMLTAGVPKPLGFSNALFLVFYAVYALILLHLATAKPEHAQNVPPGIRSYAKPLPRLAAGAAVIWLGGMAIEWSGVHTGWPFGGYAYSWILGPHLFGVPITLGFAWIAVIGNSALIAGPVKPTFSGRISKAVQIGFWTVLIDFVLDPAAASRGFWNWSGTGGFYGIPWSNFTSWFGVGALLSLLLPDRLPSVRIRLLGLRLYQLILLMFGLLALQDGIYGPAGIALVGMGLSEARFRYDTRRTFPGVSHSV